MQEELASLQGVVVSVRRGLSPVGEPLIKYVTPLAFSRVRSPGCRFCLISCYLFSFGQGLSLGCGRTAQQGLVANALRPLGSL